MRLLSKRPDNFTFGNAAWMWSWVMVNGLAKRAVIAVAVLCKDKLGIGNDKVTALLLYCHVIAPSVWR